MSHLDVRPSFSPSRLVRAGLLPALMLFGSACATTHSKDAAGQEPAEARLKTSSESGGARLKSFSAAPQAGSPGYLDTSKLQGILDDAAASMMSPGLVMAVQVGNSPPWIGVTGFQDESKTQPMTPEMKFRVGSISKNFVGTAILQQVDEGKIGLDDTLEKWLPKVFNNIDGRGITIRQMLNHTSGIESYTEDENWLVTVYLQPTHYWDAPEALVKLAQGLRDQGLKGLNGRKVVQPGSQFYYSNTNFILLGMIAAKVDGYEGNAWDKVIQKRFFDRLQMRNSRIPAVRETALGSTNKGYVNFYNFLGNNAQGTANCLSVNPKCTNTDADFTTQDMSNAWSAGEIISTVGDLLTFINAEVKGDLLSPKIREQQRVFLSTCPASEPNCVEASVEVGLAMFKQLRYGFIGHRGEIFGFNGTIQYLPQKDLTVVVLSNRTALDGNHVGPIPETVAAALYPDLVPQDLPPPPTASKTSNTGPAKTRLKNRSQGIDTVSHNPLPARFR